MTCAECGAGFEAANPRTKICSDACRRVRARITGNKGYQRRRASAASARQCRVCIRDFMGVTNSVYCSNECRTIGLGAGQKKSYRTRRDEGRLSAIPQGATATQAHPSQKELHCDECGKAFWRYGSRSGRSKRGAKFCGVACRRSAIARSQTDRRGVPRVPRTDPMQCTKCEQWFPLAKYYVSKKTGLQNRRCPECCQGTTPEAKRRSHLRSHFGMTLEEWIAMHQRQDGKCAICVCALPSTNEMTESKPRGTGWTCRNWNTDHCHITGKVRGILCRPCNQALGSLRDNPETARRVANYLDEHRACSHEECANGPSGHCTHANPPLPVPAVTTALPRRRIIKRRTEAAERPQLALLT